MGARRVGQRRCSMVILDGAREVLARQASRFAYRLVPISSPVVVAARPSPLVFLPNLRQFVDVVEFSIMAAILGDAPSEHWAVGEEAMAPLEEQTVFASMPEYDNVLARF